MTPEQKEYRLQLAVVKHLDTWYKGKCEWLHIPNKPGNASDGFFKKQMGAKAGASDLLFTWNNRYLHCALIELKSPDGTLSSQQNKFLSRFNRLGWHTAVCKSVDEVNKALRGWGLDSGTIEVMEPDYRSKEEKFEDAIDFFRP